VEGRAGEYRAGGWTGEDALREPGSGIGTAAGVGTTAAAEELGTRTAAYPRGDAATTNRVTPASSTRDAATGTSSSGTLGTGTDTSPPDGTPGNPPGTAAGRAFDRAAGTNVSGAHPENESPRR
ncbi:MAG TPA: hypothetical protein VE684_04760, partial [Crenalkalicoccus sp.]|nr:hypothetical protein [Crenalkalicoccus sp.]